ncbi:hypothetical protein GSI_09334 [Ganoderma sinense ZZ0214-1]|uniref:Uncharacterized protein n=1 Tax=Ganoderma sinense ZZ0214-1 TaxID=1077348 RepID=A0A2G8S689_9APHY|nr:hypothetical protein GSI_09334 [Ganoderma sinense ZZ0214-1]
MGFFGVIVTQFILYIRRYPKDRMFLKLLVYGVTLLQAAQQVLFTVNAWGVVINPGVSGQVLQRVTASNILIDAVIVAISQAYVLLFCVYYAGRGMRKIHASITSSKLLLIIGTEVHFGTGQHGLSVVSSDDDTMIKGILISVNAVTWSTDVLLSAIFVYSLLKSRTGSSFGNRLVDRVAYLNMNIGVLPSLSALAMLPMFQTPSSQRKPSCKETAFLFTLQSSSPI